MSQNFQFIELMKDKLVIGECEDRKVDYSDRTYQFEVIGNGEVSAEFMVYGSNTKRTWKPLLTSPIIVSGEDEATEAFFLRSTFVFNKAVLLAINGDNAKASVSIGV